MADRQIAAGEIVECVPTVGGKPILVKVLSVNGEVGKGYRLRRSDLTPARRSMRRRNGAVVQSAHRPIIVSFGCWSVTRIIRDAAQEEARRG